ncbi:MAG: UTP--glucose-1-phosphate uridylyltransferase [Desulfobacterales bacterium]|nr:UTP--glucose-1-phosphate uridylyltransferase [Desulfobacterales bacterium]
MADSTFFEKQKLFVEKMEKHKLPSVVIDNFSYYYEKIISGEKGLIFNKNIEAVQSEDIEDFNNIEKYVEAGKKVLNKAVMIVLNGGLGTSMGLTKAKSLIRVKNNLSFLEIIIKGMEALNVRLVLMNSFSTNEDTISEINKINPLRQPEIFLQHKFPKIIEKDFTPAEWPKNKELEWNPPGHGDIYTALQTSGMLKKLLNEGIKYAFISNCDNLGASLEEALLGYFSEKNLPFMMEVSDRTPSDIKGGHLARSKNGGLLLRESAQCPSDEISAFQDINLFHFFNTNNIWVNLEFLNTLIKKEKSVKLPIILNPKNLDPRDEKSPKVYQVETAMGSAIFLFEGASAIKVHRSRFFPVKKCNDLLTLQSDCYILSEGYKIIENPERKLERIKIQLDSKYYNNIDDYEKRFPEGIPSLQECKGLTVKGDVLFEKNITIKNDILINNTTGNQVIVKEGTIIEKDLIF